MKDFLEVIRSRKSIRSFSDKPVSRNLIEKLIDAAVQAPTNCNQQLWNFIIIDDLVIKERIIKEAAGNTLFRRAPALLAVTYDGWNYKEAIQGASLAVGHLLLAANYYGVGASPVNSYGADSKIKRILGIPEREVICCFVTLGYPDKRAETASLVPRKSSSEVIHINQFEKRVHPPYTYNPDDWTLNDLRAHQKHYCRKTFWGKEMDIANALERELVRKTLNKAEGPFLDLFSYDGSYLPLFPEKSKITTVDITKETAEYSKAAASISEKVLSEQIIYDENVELSIDQKPHTITLIFKTERIPKKVLTRVFAKAYKALPKGGKVILIARKSSLFWWIFFTAVRLLFGRDIRSTGMYAFFGPYRPVRVSWLKQAFREAGFKSIVWSGYFPFPAFYAELFQMYLQYKRSEGSSYLHRERQKNIITKLIDRFLRGQGFMRAGFAGSVVVMTCTK